MLSEVTRLPCTEASRRKPKRLINSTAMQQRSLFCQAGYRRGIGSRALEKKVLQHAVVLFGRIHAVRKQAHDLLPFVGQP